MYLYLKNSITILIYLFCILIHNNTNNMSVFLNNQGLEILSEYYLFSINWCNVCGFNLIKRNMYHLPIQQNIYVYQRN